MRMKVSLEGESGKNREVQEQMGEKIGTLKDALKKLEE